MEQGQEQKHTRGSKCACVSSPIVIFSLPATLLFLSPLYQGLIIVIWVAVRGDGHGCCTP